MPQGQTSLEYPPTSRQPLRSDTENSELGSLAADGWHKCVRTMEDYDKRLLGGWREELNNLLIFAGLFSAVVTAFGVEAYSWLRPDPQDQTVELLKRISLQVSSFSANAAFLNTTIPSVSDTVSFHASSTVVSINILWFLSLSFSLASAVFAILVQQWIRQYLDFPLVAGREWASLRQRRFDGLDRWLVPQIISTLSLVLQAALMLFLVGLVTLLWTLHHVVAIAIMTAVGIFLVAFLITTITPSFAVDCPYKSPLAWAAYIIISHIVYPLLVPAERLLWWGMTVLPSSTNFKIGAIWLRVQNSLPRYKCTSWPEYQGKQQTLNSEVALRAIRWTSTTLGAAAIDPDVIAACLVHNDNPIQALFQWIANVSGMATDSVQATVKIHPWWGYASVWLQKPEKVDKRVAQALVRRACHYLVEHGGRHERSGYALSMMHMLRWLDIRTGADVTVSPLLWHAIESTQTTSPEHTWFLSSQLYDFYDVDTTTEQHQIGALYARKWFLRVFDTAMQSLRTGESSSFVRYAFELSWLAAYRSLRCTEHTASLAQLKEQYDPIWNAVFEYFSFEIVIPTHTTRWAWLTALEMMLKSQQFPQIHSAKPVNHYERKIHALVDLYIAKTFSDWQQDAEYAHIFSNVSTTESVPEYACLRAYLLERHPNICPNM